MKEFILLLFKMEIIIFVRDLSVIIIFDLYGIIDGKVVGINYLGKKYLYILGSVVSGIDFLELEVDLKVKYIG